MGWATLFTDFAEVDPDDSLVNLTRSLVLPENDRFPFSLDVFSFDPRAYQSFIHVASV